MGERQHCRKSGHNLATGPSQSTGHNLATGHCQITDHSLITGHNLTTGHSLESDCILPGHSQATGHNLPGNSLTDGHNLSISHDVPGKILATDNCSQPCTLSLLAAGHILGSGHNLANGHNLDTYIPLQLHSTHLVTPGHSWSHLVTGNWSPKPKFDLDLSPREGFGSISLKVWEP